MPLERFRPDAGLTSILSPLRRDGAVIVNGLAGARLVDAVRDELRPELDRAGLETGSHFNGSPHCASATSWKHPRARRRSSTTIWW